MTCGGARKDVSQGCARARGLGRRAGSAVCFAGPRPGTASVERRCGRLGFHIQYVKCHRQEPNSRRRTSTGDLERRRAPRSASAGARRGTRTGDTVCKTAARAAPARAGDARSEPLPFRRVIQSLHTHTEALIPFVCPQYVHTQHSSSSRAQRVIAQLSQGRQSRI